MILHLVVHCSIRCRCLWSRSVSVFSSGPERNKEVSSANWAVFMKRDVGMSAVKILKRVGERGEP